MKKTVGLLLILTISIVAFLGAVFQFRTEIREAYGKWSRGPVPPPVSRQQAQQDAAVAGATNAPDAVKPATNTNTATPKPTNTNAPAPKPATTTNVPAAPKPAPAPTKAPATFNMSVLFVPQAPHKVWDAKHEDACEEASMLMLEAYLNDTTKMSIDEMEKGIDALVEYQTKVFGEGGWKSTTAEQTAAVMRDFLGIKGTKAVTITSIEDVKRAVAKGTPVILPADGRQLFNPNFKNGGPVYHMLVAKGYTETTIITNDPGTRLGADYAYKNAVLWNAIHDWNGGDTPNGAKVMIVVE